MKLELLSIGKQHDKNLKDAIEDFTNRIDKYFSVDWKLIATPKNTASLSENELKKAEAELIFQQIKADDYVVLLDEKGEIISSVDLANFIQQRANSSCKKVIFLVGGAFGVDKNISKRANYILSLSKLVFPHMLVRLILAEQVYRACSILKNEKYHHI